MKKIKRKAFWPRMTARAAFRFDNRLMHAIDEEAERQNVQRIDLVKMYLRCGLRDDVQALTIPRRTLPKLRPVVFKFSYELLCKLDDKAVQQDLSRTRLVEAYLLYGLRKGFELCVSPDDLRNQMTGCATVFD